MRVRQVIDPWQHGAKHLAVRRDAADGDATETDTVITLFPSDQAGPRTVTTNTVIGERHLQRRVHGFRARIDEECVIYAFRRNVDQSIRQFEHGGVTQLERHRVVQRLRLRLYRLDDLRVTVPRIAAPQSGNRIEQLFTVMRVAIHAVGPRDDARMLFEITVTREWHPVRLEIR